MVNCLNCNSYFEFKKIVSKKIFCSDFCCYQYHNNKKKVKRVNFYCIYCKKELLGQQKKYCSSICKCNYFYHLKKDINRERRNMLQREYMKRNPLLRRINDHKRRSKIINNGNSSIINYKYFRKKMIQIKCCTYCNKELSYNKSEYNKQNYATIDHVIPLINGGTNELNNLVFCCRSCNVKKGRRGVDYFESELRKL